MTLTTLTPTQRRALSDTVDAVECAVRAAGTHGAPGGVIYSGLMMLGCSYSQYTSLMGAMVRNGRLRRDGELYFVMEK